MNGPGNELGVNLGFTFITDWYRNYISSMKQGAGILHTDAATFDVDTTNNVNM